MEKKNEKLITFETQERIHKREQELFTRKHLIMQQKEAKQMERE